MRLPNCSNPRDPTRASDRRTACLRLAFFSLIVLVTFLGAAWTAPAAERDAPKLNWELIKGPVRVILLRVGWRTPTNEPPALVVTYAVEIPQKGAFSDLHFRGNDEIAVAVRGRPLLAQQVSSSSMGFRDLPAQRELIAPVIRDGFALLAEELVLRGLADTNGRLWRLPFWPSRPPQPIRREQLLDVDLKIQFAWRGTNLVFDFKAVPVN